MGGWGEIPHEIPAHQRASHLAEECQIEYFPSNMSKLTHTK